MLGRLAMLTNPEIFLAPSGTPLMRSTRVSPCNGHALPLLPSDRLPDIFSGRHPTATIHLQYISTLDFVRSGIKNSDMSSEGWSRSSCHKMPPFGRWSQHRSLSFLIRIAVSKKFKKFFLSPVPAWWSWQWVSMRRLETKLRLYK